jgi:hypothetical protein
VVRVFVKAVCFAAVVFLAVGMLGMMLRRRRGR